MEEPRQQEASQADHVIDLMGHDEGGLDDLKQTRSYKDAFRVLKGKAHGVPNLPLLQDTLAEFKDEDGKLAFTCSLTRNNFSEIQRALVQSYRPTKSGRNKYWKKDYVAEYLGLIIANKWTEDELTKSRKRSADVHALDDDISLALKNLLKLYQPCLDAYVKHQRAEKNKKHRTPSLNLQKTGTRRQDSVQFDKSKAFCDPCAVCGCSFTTMPLECQRAVDAENEARRAASVDGKFAAKSAVVGCYCFQDPTTVCMCQATYEKSKEHTIALAIRKNKEKERKSKNAIPPPQTGASALYTQLDKHFQNNMLRQMQNVDPSDDIDDNRHVAIQNAASLSAINIIEDSTSLDRRGRRELTKTIPRSTTILYRPPTGGSAVPKTITQARRLLISDRKAAKSSGEIIDVDASPVDRVPHASVFLSNRNQSRASRVEKIPDANRRRRNNLSPVPLNVKSAGLIEEDTRAGNEDLERALLLSK